MSQKKYPKLTDKQQYEKYMTAYDAWVKKDMLKSAPEIEANIRKMEAARYEQG